MPLYQHVLAAVDFGAHSAKVLQSAAAMAQLCGAELSVLHVVGYPVVTDIDYTIPSVYEVESKLMELAEKQLRELLKHEALNHNVRPIIVSGRAKDEIANTAEKEKVDLIVIGAHGRHGLAKLLGSTANRVLSQAPCNVLVVR